MPRLSFVVPVYRPKREVFERVVKALSVQALKDFDAIFVLDGPSDEARAVIAKAKDKRFRIEEIPHSGAQAARNFGGTLATGDFLCFFDSDCVIEPGASQMWVEQFDKHPEVGFIYSGYKFFGEKYAIESEPWDPWTLKVRNYISGCFPMRRELYPGWREGLKSLQDWDMWLTLLEVAEHRGYDLAKVGLFVRGYAFATAMPDPESISGQGCLPEVWLERVDAVKKAHGLKDRDVCVSSLQYRHDGIALAKLIGADYLDFPNDKPHRYKTIVQVGFSMGENVEKHAAMFQEKGIKKVVFWTGDNINEIYNAVSFRQIDAMSQLLNDVASQYVEDKEAKRLMERAGFKVKILPIPLGKANVMPLPEVKKWAVDIAGAYSPVMAVIERSLPDIPLEMVGPATRISEYTGLLHFFPDRSRSNTIKRAQLTGRHVVSNVDEPFCGYTDDKGDVEKFVAEVVEKVRALSSQKPDPEASEAVSTKRVLSAVAP